MANNPNIPDPLIAVKEIENVVSPFKIYKGDDFWNKVDELCPLNDKIKPVKDQLTSAKFTKFVCPFSVLVGATDKFPDNNLLYVANALAYLLDYDNDGSAQKYQIQK